MPSAATQLLTRAHRQRLDQIAGLTERQIAQLAETIDTADIDRWWQRVEARALRSVQEGTQAMTQLTAGYLRRHAGLERVRVTPAPAPFNPERARTSLRVAGPVAFKTHLTEHGDVEGAVRVTRSQLTGSADRLARFGDRETLTLSIRENQTLRGYQRIGGGKTCAFCTMLISRGPVYGADGADFDSHPRCGCSAEPVYSTSTPMTEEAERARALYDKAGGDLKELRRMMSSV